MNELTSTTQELNRVFNLLNEKYFEGELETPIITLQRKRSNNLGHFTLSKIWKNKETEDCRYEININPINLDRPIVNICETLLHEACHMYAKMNEIKDCNGQNHNKRFKAIAEERDLVCEKHKSYGYGITHYTEAFNKFIQEEVKPDEECFKYFMAIPKVEDKEKKPTNKKIFKYICKECGQEIKAKMDAHVKCGLCNVEFEMEEE